MEFAAAVIVIVTLVVMTTGVMPAVLALTAALVLAGLIGIAPPNELFAGLSNGGVITIAAMLVIAKGVLSTGVVTRVTYRLLSGVSTAGQALVRLIPPVGVVSSLINTTPIVAMLIPAARELQQNTGVAAKQVLLPVAHATTLAGSMTLIGTSSNLLIAGLAAPAGVEIRMFTFVPLAAPVAVVGWLVLLVTARVMLRGAPEDTPPSRSWRVEIPISGHANAVGRNADSLGIGHSVEFELVEIRRWGRPVGVDCPIEASDVLVYQATETGVRALWGSPRFGLDPQRLYAVTIGEDEQETVRDLEDDEDLLVVAAQSTRPLRDTPAVAGSTCYVTVPDVAVLTDHPHVGLWQNVAGKAPQTRKTWVALAILAAVIVAASIGLAPVELIAAGGAVVMVLTGVLTPRSAARALDWKILFILAGSIGLGTIVVSSGLGRRISDGIVEISGGSALAVVVVLAVGTTILTNVVTNAAAAAILTPVCLTIAAHLDINPVILLILLGTCISFTFLNPFSHQSNLMVMGPGGYSTATFARYGLPLIVVCVAAAIGMGWLLLTLG